MASQPIPSSDDEKTTEKQTEDDSDDHSWRELPWFPPGHRNRRLFIFRIWDDSDCSIASVVMSIISGSFVVLSTVALVVSSLPGYRYPRYGTSLDSSPAFFEQIELICVLFFTIEYIFRMGCCSAAPIIYILGGDITKIHKMDTSRLQGWRGQLLKTWIFAKQRLNVIDLIAILPFYLEGITGTSINLTSLRVVRLLRLAKFFRKNKMIPLIMDVFMRSAIMLAQVMLILPLFLFFFAAVIYLCEQGKYNDSTGNFERKNLFGRDEESPYDSIFMALWWVIVTGTTVGYGDISPTTLMGRISASVIIFICMVLFAVPVTIITATFVDLHQGVVRKLQLKEDGRTSADKELSILVEGTVQDNMLRNNAKKVLVTRETKLPWIPEASTLPERLFLILEALMSSWTSVVCQSVVFLTILFSTLTLAIESLPVNRYPNYGTEQGDSAPVFAVIEAICTSIFTVELVLRLVTVPFVSGAALKNLDYNCDKSSPWYWRCTAWFFSFGTIIDIASVLPYYLELTSLKVPNLAFIRLLRLFRMGRFLKVLKRLTATLILMEAMQSSFKSLISLAVLFCVWICLGSSIVFYCEEGKYNESTDSYMRQSFNGVQEETPFQSIPDTFWWMIVTMTTVGYGDMYPTSLAGRIVGAIILFFSIISLALPISVVGVNIDAKARKYLRINRTTMQDEDSISLNLENPSFEFKSQSMAGLQDIRNKLEDMSDIFNYYARCDGGEKGKTSRIFRDVSWANMLLAKDCVTDVEPYLVDIDTAVKKLRTAYTKMTNSQCRTRLNVARIGLGVEQNGKTFFKKMMRRRASIRTFFFAWAVYTQNKKEEGGQNLALAEEYKDSKEDGEKTRLEEKREAGLTKLEMGVLGVTGAGWIDESKRNLMSINDEAALLQSSLKSKNPVSTG